ncbi:MAG TPA: hypothetical protein VI789_01710 [Dehalococcoidia bacterium]|nr:hypothetical protein [Dehalococcoidia bacterium]
MSLIGILVVAPLWGAMSTQLFLQAWLAVINVVSSVIGLARAKVPRKWVFLGLGVYAVQAIVFPVLLGLGYYLLSEKLSFGYTSAENIVYWIFALLSLLYMLPQLPRKVKKAWRNANVRGSLELDISSRRLRDIESQRTEGHGAFPED